MYLVHVSLMCVEMNPKRRISASNRYHSGGMSLMAAADKPQRSSLLGKPVAVEEHMNLRSLQGHEKNKHATSQHGLITTANCGLAHCYLRKNSHHVRRRVHVLRPSHDLHLRHHRSGSCLQGVDQSPASIHGEH